MWYQFKSTYKVVFLFILLFYTLFICCNKPIEYTDNLQVQKVALSGVLYKKWILDSITINGTPQLLTPYQLKYYKIFRSNQNWEDSDGFSGTWNIQVLDSLTIKTNYFVVGGTPDYKTFQIKEMGKLYLKLLIVYNGDQIMYQYHNIASY